MKIGISGYDPSLDGKIDFFEVDLSDIGLKKIKKSALMISLNQYYYRQPNPIPLNERIEMIESKIANSKLVGFSLRLTPRFCDLVKIGSEIHLLSEALAKHFSVPVLIDHPKNSAHTTDPMWKRPTKGGYWKIHGWHDVRWVRRYSEEELSKLQRWSKRFKPDFLIFGHSQRAEQVNEFLKITAL